jgi:hypothetical protein
MTERAVTIARGDHLTLRLIGYAEPTATGGPKWARWQAVCSLMREFGTLTGCEVTVESDCWPNGRPR